jgi:hypothetical protein
MQTKLDYALAWARRGFRVFPIAENTKDTPLVASTTNDASSDEAQVRAWWTGIAGDIKSHNIGVALGRGVVVVDVDIKDNKPGLSNFLHLAGSFGSIVVETPTGGYHVYYSHQDVGQRELAPGLDVRSLGGYVLAPGSFCDIPSKGIKGAYTLIKDEGLTSPPPTIAQAFAPYAQRNTVNTAALVDLDLPSNINDAVHYLNNVAAVAIQGLGGDATTYAVCAALVKEYAISEFTALELLLKHWNPKCVPPWEATDLFTKIENANNYAVNTIGTATTAATYQGVVAVPPAQTGWRFGNAVDEAFIPPRPWLVDRMLMLGECSLLAAEGATGKSTMMLRIAAHLAVGKHIAPTMQTMSSGKSVIYNAEDTVLEMSRRLKVICSIDKLDYDVVKSKIALLSNDDVELVFLQYASGYHVNEVYVSQLIDFAVDPEIKFIGIDPVNKITTVDPSDNAGMSVLMRTMTRIARQTNTALMLATHVSKSSAGAENAGSGSAFLGAVSLQSAARIGFTMYTIGAEEAKELGIPEADKNMYVRFDDAKMNLSLKSTSALYMKRETRTLMNGDKVGGLSNLDISQMTLSRNKDLAVYIHDVMSRTSHGMAALADVAAWWTPNVDSAHAKRVLKRKFLSLGNRLEHTDETGRKFIYAIRDHAGKDVIVLD